MIKKFLLIMFLSSIAVGTTGDIDIESQKPRKIVGYKNRSIDIQTDDRDSPDQIHKFYRTENRLYCAGGFACGMTFASIFLTTAWYNGWLGFDL